MYALTNDSVTHVLPLLTARTYYYHVADGVVRLILLIKLIFFCVVVRAIKILG